MGGSDGETSVISMSNVEGVESSNGNSSGYVVVPVGVISNSSTCSSSTTSNTPSARWLSSFSDIRSTDQFRKWLRGSLVNLVRTFDGVGISDIVLNFLPVIAWLVLYAVLIGMIPNQWRPEVSVIIFPRLEKLFLFPHRWFNRDPHHILDILAAIPYTLHPILPLIMLARIVIRFGAKRGLVFARCFGTMCLLGVLTQLLLPVAPPWYYEQFGEQPASYELRGHPALLARIDRLTGNRHYQNLYGSVQNKVVFGSFPSLHAAWPYMLASFRPVIGWKMWVYTFWVWWAALYLQHHYILDLIGAAVLVEVVLFFLDPQHHAPLTLHESTL
mmetsp:Transcript_12023/g.21764  ORF Transcript_12023/g.21764 Transcript_12023/m.21764 type:complete len:329 (-) Transcript_12023:119-1105(-)